MSLRSAPNALDRLLEPAIPSLLVRQEAENLVDLIKLIMVVARIIRITTIMFI